MKSIALMAACALLICSCGNRNKNVVTQDGTVKKVEVNIKDSIRKVDGLGAVVTETYEGPIPAADAPGQDYVLKLYKQKDAHNGVFDLQQTFKKAENGNDKTFNTLGRWFIVVPDAANPDRKIYRLTPFDGSGDINFQLEGDNLHMLDQNMARIVSEHNYTLRKK